MWCYLLEGVECPHAAYLPLFTNGQLRIRWKFKVCNVWAPPFITIGLLINFLKSGKDIAGMRVTFRALEMLCFVLSVFFHVVWITQLDQEILIIIQFLSFVMSTVKRTKTIMSYYLTCRFTFM
jgi:hypothetical protein